MDQQKVSFSQTFVSRATSTLVLGVIFLSCLLTAQPKMSVVGGTKLDFGQLYTGKLYRHQVVIKNVGTDTLAITNVSATCGCTGTLMTTPHIAPNDSGVLSISFDPTRFVGQVEKAVTFDASDTSQPHVRITFKATIIKALELHPEYVMFRTTPESTATESITLKNVGETPVHILSAIPSSKDVRVAFSQNAVQPGKEATIDLIFSPAALGAAKGTLVIQTDAAHMPTLEVRYFALVSGKSSRTASSTQQK
ncbi:MAG: DUF1573 domain-containing protein [Ignavibacteriae bacterium]|nr:DUF1573 domain-containing protein [Ignavibacteria bacterium]MBI3363605.1 DUF1573 domain-containing protein [Ignavibacteriota bacterium]